MMVLAEMMMVGLGGVLRDERWRLGLDDDFDDDDDDDDDDDEAGDDDEDGEEATVAAGGPLHPSPLWTSRVPAATARPGWLEGSRWPPSRRLGWPC